MAERQLRSEATATHAPRHGAVARVRRRDGRPWLGAALPRRATAAAAAAAAVRGQNAASAAPDTRRASGGGGSGDGARLAPDAPPERFTLSLSLSRPSLLVFFPTSGTLARRFDLSHAWV